MKIKNLFFVLLIMLFGCREELFIDDIVNEKLLVVDGSISNSEGPFIINLSYSSLTSSPKKNPVANCNVTIKDNNGNIEELEEAEKGSYVTSTNFHGIIGSEYQLLIKTPEGKEYKSDFQEIKNIVEIDSVYAQLAYIHDADLPYDLPGYQFYISTKVAPNNNNYFLWNMAETYEYEVDNKLKYIETRFGQIIYNNPRYDTLNICWKTSFVNYFYTGKTTNLSTPAISDKPLHFVSTDSKKLSKKYSILVNQLRINKQAYNYWKNIENQMSDNNFLSTTQPFDIQGNVKNTNNPSEKVLGYFTVASVSSKRMFINRPNVPFYYPTCVVITDPRSISEYKRTHIAPFFFVEIGEGVYGISDEKCLDCRNQGGTPSKPDFWIN